MSLHEPMISLRNISLSYPVKAGFLKWSKYTTLKDISFDLHQGETVGVIGRNGAGKTTLLRIIAGTIEPDSGSILKNGVRVSLLSLGLGFIPHLSGRENAILSGILLGLRKKEISSKIDAIIEFSGLEQFIDQPLHTYSAGMRARLGFSVAVQVDPDVLLIDEVLGVGDKDFIQKSTAEMKRLIKSDKAVVLVSHNLPIVKELCDSVIWIENGVIKAAGNTDEILKLYIGNGAK